MSGDGTPSHVWLWRSEKSPRYLPTLEDRSGGNTAGAKGTPIGRLDVHFGGIGVMLRCQRNTGGGLKIAGARARICQVVRSSAGGRLYVARTVQNRRARRAEIAGGKARSGVSNDDAACHYILVSIRAVRAGKASGRTIGIVNVGDAREDHLTFAASRRQA